MLCFSNFGKVPILENLSETASKCFKSFSTSFINSSSISISFNISIQATREERGVPNWCAVSLDIKTHSFCSSTFETFFAAKNITIKKIITTTN